MFEQFIVNIVSIVVNYYYSIETLCHLTKEWTFMIHV